MKIVNLAAILGLEISHLFIIIVVIVVITTATKTVFKNTRLLAKG
jgi:hypothetical protein